MVCRDVPPLVCRDVLRPLALEAGIKSAASQGKSSDKKYRPRINPEQGLLRRREKGIVLVRVFRLGIAAEVGDVVAYERGKTPDHQIYQ